MKRVQDKVAMVTGGLGAIGTGIVRRLAEEGAHIVITDVRDDGSEKAVAAAKSFSGDAIFLQHDVGSESSWNDVFARSSAHFGRVDILVNNAGVGARQGQPFDSITFEEWRRVLGVNLDGVFLGTSTAVKNMKSTGGGSIVNIGSIAGLKGTRGGAAYGTSKGGVHTLTKQAAFSCAKHNYGIRVNCILPSYVWTPLVADRAIAEFGSEEAARQKLGAMNPLNRVGEPDDIAYAVLYLASSESRFVTGIELVVDGGSSIA